jgi:multimeric flavodoxin WrbA
MKVLAFNSSPKEKAGTASILTPFLEGMGQAGAEVELFFLRKLDIKPCLGDFACWLETPGQCVHKDDMQMLYPKLAASDIIVFATPVYVDGMTGTMKMLLDRFVPLVLPFIEIRDGHCRHPFRHTSNPAKVVLVSVCGFPEMDNFDPLVSHMEAICKNMGADFAGALLRPYASALPRLKERGFPVDDIYEAAGNAGRQLVQDGKMTSETLAAVSREVVPRETYVQGANAYFQQALDALDSK